jgi:hypothetical protein
MFDRIDRAEIRIHDHHVTLFTGSSICVLPDGLGVLLVPPPLSTPDRSHAIPIYATAYWPDRTLTLPLTQT